MNNIRCLSAFITLVLSGSLAAQTLVTVNGQAIDSKDIERRAKIFETNSNGTVKDGPELRYEITNELIVETFVTQEAKRLKLDKSERYKAIEAEALKEIKAKGLDKEKDFKQNWADYQNHLLMESYAVDFFEKHPVNETEIRQQYDRIKKRYDNGEEIQLGEIFTDKPAQTQAALKELKAKKKFSDVAAKYSLSDNVKQTGGIVPEYMPLIDLKEINQSVYDAVQKLNKGQYTQTPLQDGNIHLILYINDKRKITVPSLNQMKDGIEQNLQYSQWREHIDALGKQAKIVPAN